MADRRAILVIAAGDAKGGAIARHFARVDYVACVMRRNADKLAPKTMHPLAIVTAGGGGTRANCPTFVLELHHGGYRVAIGD